MCYTRNLFDLLGCGKVYTKLIRFSKDLVGVELASTRESSLKQRLILNSVDIFMCIGEAGFAQIPVTAEETRGRREKVCHHRSG